MTTSIKGFKAMNSDMTCREYQFEVGGTYEIEGELEICKNGFHFCQELRSVFGYYNHSGIRLFEVEALGETVTHGNKSVTSKIKIVKEVFLKDVYQELKNDEHRQVREAVAKQGYALDELKNDEDCYVREAVAKQGYALDELKNDEDCYVREAALRKIEELSKK